jgi:hypothetical protein
MPSIWFTKKKKKKKKYILAADANSVDAIISGLEFDEKNKTLFVSFAK